MVSEASSSQKFSIENLVRNDDSALCNANFNEIPCGVDVGDSSNLDSYLKEITKGDKNDQEISLVDGNGDIDQPTSRPTMPIRQTLSFFDVIFPHMQVIHLSNFFF